MKQTRPLHRVVIKEEYVALTGDHVSAVLLNQIEYWTIRTHDFDRFLAEEKGRAIKNGKDLDVSLTHGWIYKTAQDLSEETMMHMSVATIRTRLKKLVERGWIGERTNPLYKWDQTKQYRFNASKVAADLEELGYHLEGWVPDERSLMASSSNPEKGVNGAILNFKNRVSNFENRSCDILPSLK